MNSGRAVAAATVMLITMAMLVACGKGTTARLAGGGASTIAWEKDLDAALAKAGGEGKIVMVDFYADWCGWCKKLDETTLADANVQTSMKRLVAVKLDAERDGRGAAERYGVEGFPTVVFLDARGREVGRIPGYVPPAEFLTELRGILDKA